MITTFKWRDLSNEKPGCTGYFWTRILMQDGKERFGEFYHGPERVHHSFNGTATHFCLPEDIETKEEM